VASSRSSETDSTAEIKAGPVSHRSYSITNTKAFVALSRRARAQTTATTITMSKHFLMQAEFRVETTKYRDQKIPNDGYCTQAGIFPAQALTSLSRAWPCDIICLAWMLSIVSPLNAAPSSMAFIWFARESR